MMSPTTTRRVLAAVIVGALVITAIASSTAVALRWKRGQTRDESWLRLSGVSSLSPTQPIPGEAALWRAERAAYAIDARANRRQGAHPRTLATWRMLRAFPGAPPRIPHGLTADEALTSSCNKCHLRGDYSQRFGSYAPITPHGELEPCTRCHVPDAAVTGIALQTDASDPNARCRQCHSPETMLPMGTAASVALTTWPRVAARSEHGTPPVIPHDGATRGNCRSCHVGPGAVAEIRTSHPERTNCRQCHVTEERTQ